MTLRENSFSDGDSGRSLTPDLEEGDELQQAALTNARANAAQQPSPAVNTAVSASKGPATATTTAPRVRIPHSNPVSPMSPRAGPPPLSGADRFRATVRKVMAMHRTSSMLATSVGGVGAEPGIDPRKSAAAAMYGHIHQPCTIEIIDYSSVKHSFAKISNEQFVQMMQDPEASKREDKMRIRWINIAGISWDVLSALALRYDLHPLALEDVLHQPRSGLLSKVDYYRKHIFLRVLCHTLAKGDEDHEHDPMLYADPMLNHSYGNLTSGITGLPRSTSPDGEKYDRDRTVKNDQRLSFGRFSTAPKATDSLPLYKEKTGASPPAASRLSTSSKPPPRSAAQHSKLKHAQGIERLKQGDRVDVKIQPLCIFLVGDHTVISVSRGRSLEFTAPIRERLKHPDTGLRLNADASMLVQALLDLLVDRVFEVVDEYHSRILALEHAVLLHPRMKHVRLLHILQGDLNQHKRTLEPVKTVAYGLRRYDVDRTAANIPDAERDPTKPVKGFMSHKAKIYLADVVDHMDYVLTSLDMFIGTTENLINYSFNMTSNEMNVVMKRLTLATIIFLPLTLLTGYFGMNFQQMWSVHNLSDVFFWELGIPLVLVMVTIFMWRDFRDMAHYVSKRIAGRRDGDTMLERKHQ